MQENKFTETFDLSLFIQDEDFESLIHRFENDRKPEQIKKTTSVMTVEEFINSTESKEDAKKSNKTIKDK
jgi:hypothetical protein